MFCSKCGAPNPVDASFCSNCGAILAAMQAAGTAGTRNPGFGPRFGAWVLDGVLCSILGFFSILALTAAASATITPVLGGSLDLMQLDQLRETLRNIPVLTKAAFVLGMLSIGLIPQWLYFALQESSAARATIGKRIVGLRVSDAGGNRLGFGQASARWLIKTIVTIVPLGSVVSAIVLATDERARSIHDRIAGTEVRGGG